MRGKITAAHLERRAYVYVRQSTPSQVMEHAESTKRQYALAERARSLGWAPEAVEVIDEDLGRSGASTEGRSGFARLAEAVSNGQAGAVLAVEVSRLARSSTDWQRLLSLCAVADVPVVDEQTIYDAADKDDKLLLDLKGTMSEAELHWLSLRLAGARQSKARRGELRLPAPTGYVWTEQGFSLDPDESVQRAVRTVFERYEVEPSAWAVVRWARQVGLLFPCRGAGGGELSWKPLGVSRLCALLNNPVYAGAYVYGRKPIKQVLVQGQIRRVRQQDLAPEHWLVVIKDAHPGYISWESYVNNRKRLGQSHGRNGGAGCGAPRAGEALLVGLAICGRCGRRMKASYDRSGRYSYVCSGQHDIGGASCWSVSGRPIDQAVEQLLLSTVIPSELELGLAVEREVEAQAHSLAEQWRARIEQAQYAARLAERRYKAVDPENRVVARTLERQWEERLRELEQVQRQYEEARHKRHVELSEADRRQILALARDLPAVWRSKTTTAADRKAMLRLVIEAISLRPVQVPQRQTCLEVQWQGGAVSQLRLARPGRREARRTPQPSVERIRALAAEGLADEQIARQLDRERMATGSGASWSEASVKWVRRQFGISRTAPDRPRREPLAERRADGLYSVSGVARRFGVSTNVVRGWMRRGLLRGERQDHGPHRNVWWLELDEATVARLKPLALASRLGTQGADNIRRQRVPDQREDGRQSVAATARRFGVQPSTVRRWIRAGLVEARLEAFGPYPAAWWLEIDQQTAARLEHAARQSASLRGIERANRRQPLPDQRPDGRYSVTGLAKRYGVTENVVRGWMKRGLVRGIRAKHRDHGEVWWLELDETTDKTLDQIAKKAQNRKTLSGNNL
jgi:DNA invertase Pin-like site-specific DNA recombinase